MALRPAEQVLLQTLDDIDPKQAERLRKELYEVPKPREHALGKTLERTLIEIVQLIQSAMATLRHRS